MVNASDVVKGWQPSESQVSATSIPMEGLAKVVAPPGPTTKPSWVPSSELAGKLSTGALMSASTSHNATTSTKPPARVLSDSNSVDDESSGPQAADYVRAIKLVRGVAYPWPPPTKSSKAGLELQSSTIETLVGV